MQSLIKVLLLFVQLAQLTHSLQPPTSPTTRRSFLESIGAITIGSPIISANAAQPPPSLTFSTAKSGIQWADAKVGTGPETKSGSTVTVDYVLSTTGARYGAKIYSTKDKGSPYRWKLGDGSTITGLENSILGSEDIPPMRPGGIRRVVIPSNLAYISLKESTSCNGVGPIPPTPEAFEEFQRFKNIYCNPERAYQPDIVMDIKLYGKRTVD